MPTTLNLNELKGLEIDNNTKGTNINEIQNHISLGLSTFESARTGFFAFVIPVSELGNLYSPNYSGVGEATENDVYDPEKYQKAITLAVTKCSVPHYKVATHDYRRGNDIVHFAGVPEFNAGSLTVADYVGLDTKSLLMAWLRLAYDPHTRKGGRMQDYKKSCQLIEYTQDYEVVRTWDLEGCFITELSEDNFDKESDGPRSIEASFVYDRAIMSIPKDEEEE